MFGAGRDLSRVGEIEASFRRGGSVRFEPFRVRFCVFIVRFESIVVRFSLPVDRALSDASGRLASNRVELGFL